MPFAECRLRKRRRELTFAGYVDAWFLPLISVPGGLKFGGLPLANFNLEANLS
jgi:hypothetical protein